MPEDVAKQIAMLGGEAEPDVKATGIGAERADHRSQFDGFRPGADDAEDLHVVTQRPARSRCRALSTSWWNR